MNTNPPNQAAASVPQDAPLLTSAVQRQERADGSVLLAWPHPLDELPLGPADRNAPLDRRVPNVVDWLPFWAREQPGAVFMAERDRGGQWQAITWAEAWDRVQGIAAGLLEQQSRLGAEQLVLAVLSTNSVRQALVTFAALYVGVVVAPVSPSYVSSTQSERLTTVMDILRPQLVYCEDLGAAGDALARLGWPADCCMDREAVDAWGRKGNNDSAAVARAHAAAHGDATAKIMFTSGSTGIPKGVRTTHDMLAAAQATSAANLLRAPANPGYLEWLPWHHVMGGNVNLNRILRFGGSAWLDEGRPVPGRFAATLANLREIAPSFYFNVPLGYAMLVPALEADEEAARRFFSNLDYVSYGGAMLAPELVERFDRLALRHKGHRIAFTSAYGATETSGPGLTTGPGMPNSGALGLPSPGVVAKLVPAGDRYELRLRGRNVRADYLGQPEATAAAHDDEGFYRTGDAVRWVDAQDPARGLVFAGRISEDFKLSSGTWVNVGAARMRLLEALGPLATDAAIAGHDREHVGALVFIDEARSREFVQASALTQELARRLALCNGQQSGSSHRIERILVLAGAPNAEAFEITEKGYLNQRAVLQARAREVERLYTEDAAVLTQENPS